MDHNIAAWMIAGGPRVETQQDRREREQLHAYLDGQHAASERAPGLVARIRDFVRPIAPAQPACCAA